MGISCHEMPDKLLAKENSISRTVMKKDETLETYLFAREKIESFGDIFQAVNARITRTASGGNDLQAG